MNLAPKAQRTFRYSNCESLDAWLRCGWMVVGHYRTFWGTREAFILEWKCSCPLGTPKKYEKGLAGGQAPCYPVPVKPKENRPPIGPMEDTMRDCQEETPGNLS